MPEADLAEIKTNDVLRGSFLEEHRSFVLKIASSVCKRHLDLSCDEYSVALSAFNEAIDRYDQRGIFLSFAARVIRTRLIDFFRANGKENVLSLDEDDETGANLVDKASLQSYYLDTENEYRAMEVEDLTRELTQWGISLRDLVKVSPKHRGKRDYLKKVIATIVQNEETLKYLREKKLLPLELLEKKYQLPRKKLEPFRKYIIAGVIIQTGDYEYLRDYIR